MGCEVSGRWDFPHRIPTNSFTQVKSCFRGGGKLVGSPTVLGLITAQLEFVGVAGQPSPHGDSSLLNHDVECGIEFGAHR